MRIYWDAKSRGTKAEIVQDMENDAARLLAESEPESHIRVGVERVFIYPSSYGVSGYSLTLEDLERLAQALRANSTDSFA
ncbi:MAG: hypothetical protein A3B99_03875 [Candidatus Yanofskybacteria bacterium RIFCSPHIGHO2_02_FULL_44_12b]|uniref:Uncharacterized protein n=2 Tax=Candidatus Yanofskyibacteriota TaxID=1752733 RepID=A0A1F8GMS9_9BACT|nr:MAG: hypothetical protein UW79_C0035G0011 [Candidatus Yanofskybacteria bacterium GW2011_GWA2_44_9]OGN04677.1 MAG: hypothetical protein A2659_00965 [Candidatus Yanofskybacteria bacterium RIFCSPHIGHO2_01_FULL_44_24]OGN15658.1 MAG: hypothetical protein A3B99_03875 [Candidatus Yanofskybacteria bacterium RIFCSPHIGHO2_02_FULL_44_12b]OGN26714.1 MAG: hypothetical protein A2925_03960 [Candidatus Yanofskybacteria bacterium RIFCSPLOWO2_01_FULL_44_22]